MNRDFTDISAKKEQEEQDTRLNIALVNEDVGVNKNSTDYNLGSDYVKKIEKDVTYNWFTVSRGIAENGLKNGTYNLLVTIPSNFSSKLLEIDSQSPEKIQVNYKINANGNATLENESRSVGRKIVNDLNQQLVDLYVASIVDNLYTAQKNIEKVYTNQTQSVDKFNNILYEPTVAFKSNFPSLSSYSENALQSNDLLKNSLTSTTEGADSLVTNQKDYASVLEALMAQRAEGKLTYEDFVKSLISLDDTLSSSDTQALFQKVAEMSDYFQTQFASQDNGEFFVQTDALNQQLAASKEQIALQQEKLSALKDSFYETYKNQFLSSFDISNSEEVTLRDVLRKKDSLSSSGDNSVSKFDQIFQFNQTYLSTMQTRLNTLPYIEIDDSNESEQVAPMDAIFTYANAPYWDSEQQVELSTKSKEIITKVTQINQKIDEANASLSESTPKISNFTLPDLTTQQASENYARLSNAYTTLINKRENLLKKNQSFTIKWSKVAESATIKLKIPAGVTDLQINNQAIDTTQINSADNSYTYSVKKNNSQTTLKISYQFSSDYNEKDNANSYFDITLNQPSNYDDGKPASFSVSTEDSSEVAETETSESSGEEPTPSVRDLTPYVSQTQYGYSVNWTQAVDTSNFLSQDYQQAKKVYSEELGRTYELYDAVNSELDTFTTYPFESFHTFLDMSLTDVFKAVLNEVFMSNDGDYQKQYTQLETLMKTAEEIEAQKNTIQGTLIQVNQTSNQLSEEVATQLTLLEQLVTNSSEMTQKNTLVTSDNDQSDTQIDSINTTLKSLLQQSETMKQTSETNVGEAEGVKNIFDSFDKEVKSAQQNGEQLSTNADTIKQNLDNELKNNNDFVSAFIKVLNNAHKDGVPNNTLLQFIANPVNGKADATIKTTEINEPFTWILIMFTLSLFIAYLFATQPVVKKIKDRFKREKLWLKDNLLETALLSLSAIGIGLILGILSISELSIRKEAQLLWIIMMILFMLIFSLVNHYLLKQFHIAGFGLSLFLFISYVFVTNAIGKTKGNNPFVTLIQSINPLSIGETNLADILANDPVNVVHIILYLLAIAALILFNIFIWKPKRLAKETVKK